MKLRKLALLLGAAAVLGWSAPAAHATITFVGDWEVDQGPSWGTQPLGYSGVTAAQLLFGAGTYEISTTDDLVADINNMAWYSVWGIGGGFQFAQDYLLPGETLYVSTGTFNVSTENASAYVNDNALGAQFTNFAFLVSDVAPVPEPAGLLLFGTALTALGAIRRRARA